jgi:hypothetical protein
MALAFPTTYVRIGAALTVKPTRQTSCKAEKRAQM